MATHTLAYPTLLHDAHYDRTVAVVQALRSNPAEPVRITPLRGPAATRIDHSRASIQPSSQVERDIAAYFTRRMN